MSVVGELTAKVKRAIEILQRQFGTPVWRRKQPLDELMITLLSQNTNDGNRDLAYRRLREMFPEWRSVLGADVGDIEEAIRPAGLGRQKAARMKEILRWVNEEFGGLNLDAIHGMSDDDALGMLTARRGIGVKTAAVVLAFAFDRDLCPVDTHVHRIAGRLGWVDGRLSAEATFLLLRKSIPAGVAPTFHLNLLKFGREICTARKPNCAACPLWDDCVWDGKTGKSNGR